VGQLVAAAAAGVAPAVLGYLPTDGALVIEWIDAETMSAAALDDSRVLAAVASTCRQLHAGPQFSGDFDMFALQRRYLDLVSTRDTGCRRRTSTSCPRSTHPSSHGRPPAGSVRATTTCWPRTSCATRIAVVHRLRVRRQRRPLLRAGQLVQRGPPRPDRLEELVSAYCGGESPAKTPGAPARADVQLRLDVVASIQDATSELDFDFCPGGWRNTSARFLSSGVQISPR